MNHGSIFSEAWVPVLEILQHGYAQQPPPKKQFVMIQQNSNINKLLQAQATEDAYCVFHTLPAIQMQTVLILPHFIVQSHWWQDINADFQREESASF